MSSNLPSLITYLQSRTLDWTSPLVTESNLFLWNVISGHKNLDYFQESILYTYSQKKPFSILVITGPEENSDQTEDQSKLYKAIESLLSDFKVSVPLSSEYFLGFLTWENLITDLDFQTWKTKYFSLTKKKKIELLKSIHKNRESKELKSAKVDNLKNSDEIIAIVSLAKKNPTFKKITYVVEETEFACVLLIAVQVFGIMATYDSRTLASVGDMVRPSKIKGFFKGIGLGIQKLVRCVNSVANEHDNDS
jgi:hypothetical protein